MSSADVLLNPMNGPLKLRTVALTVHEDLNDSRNRRHYIVSDGQER